MQHRWEPMVINEATARFAGTGIDWWIAGGQAIDLFLGWETRPHSDLDIEVFRSDCERLFDIFDGWDLHVVSEERLAPWKDPTDLDDADFGIWLRPDAQAAWQIEIMLADGDRSEWRYRRDPTVAMRGERFIGRTATGIPYGAPEVQLLYKSLVARPKDDVDLARCLVRMTAGQRSWLADSLARTSADHPWISVLDAPRNQQHE